MENTELNPKHENHRLNYNGNALEYLGILLVNFFLNLITIGFYYPWAKEKELKFLYGHVRLNNHPFQFSGTGSEMFKGYIKAIGLFIAVYALSYTALILEYSVASVLIIYLGIIIIIPFAIHGSYRYRMSRTSWKGIRLGYRGDRSDLVWMFYKNLFFTIITFGIYASWMTINLRNYIISNIRFGSLQFEYDEDGADYFVLNLKGYFLTLITFGIYYFWWYKERYEFYVNNLKLKDEKHEITFMSMANGIDFVQLLLINFLLFVFTLGIAYPWIVSRSLNFMFDNLRIDGYVDLNEIVQTEEEYKDAMGEDIGDMLDFGFII